MMKKTLCEDDSGQTLVYVALALVVLLGFVALAIEAGHLYSERRRMQNAADAGALAGVRELCLGKPAATAVAVARDYAVNRNHATWATPVVMGTNTMTITTLEPVSLIFGGIGGVVPVSVTVAASAQGRCQSTSGGCATWPIIIDKIQYQALPPGDTIYITFDNFDCDSTLYNCTHIFSGEDKSSQRGWYSSDPNSCNVPFLRGALNGGYPQFPVNIGSCVGGDSGTKMGVINGANGQEIDDWLASHTDHRVIIPLFNCYGGNGPGADGGCACQKIGSCQGSYQVGGFACLEVIQWWKKDLDVPPAPGKTKGTSIKKVLEVKIRNDCTTYCGQKNGDPVNGDALIPALVH